MGLSKDQIARYSRQIILPEIGVEGQQRLLDASVLVVGAGGLGCPSALYLAAAGVGTICIIDRETVILSNLHRQILHVTQDLHSPKAQSAKAHLYALNPDSNVIAIQESLDATNALRHIEPCDLVLDGSDNFPTRYLVNDACVLLGKPLVHGAVIHFQGQLMTILPKKSACFRCVFPEPPQPDAIPGCQEAGILGAVAGLIGTFMALEAIKLLLGLGELLVNRLLVFQGTTDRFREVALGRNPDCAVCGKRPTIHAPMDYEELCRTTNTRR